MNRCLCAIMAVIMLLCVPVFAEEDWQDDFGFAEFDDGYSGRWVQVDSLGIELCLPDGWHEAAVPDGAAFAAESDGRDASLAIRLAAEGVDDLAAWGAENLKDSRLDTANFYDVLLTGGGNAMSVYLIVSNEDVLAFDFTRKSEASLTPQLALQIIGSVCAMWDDDDVPLMDGDAGFDFGEAFEADLG